MAQKNETNERLREQLSVKSIKKEYHAWYYVVEYGGEEHYVKMFDYQREEGKKPDKLLCFIERSADGREVTIKQDLAPVIAAKYKVGGEYRFRLMRDDKHGGQYIALSPDNFKFFLDNPKNKYYVDHCDIVGRIKSINDTRVYVEEVETPREALGNLDGYVDPKSLMGLAMGLGIRPAIIRWAGIVFTEAPFFAEVRTLLGAKSAGWLGECISAIKGGMPEWITKIGKVGHQAEVLKALRTMGIEILEQSDLATGDSHETELLREAVSECVETADDFKTALDKLTDKSIVSDARTVLTSLSRTGYIYEPAHRLHVLTAAMCIDSDLMNTWAPDLFQTLAMRGGSDWKRDPLRGALLDVLTTYIDLNLSVVDKVVDIRLGDNRVKTTNMIHALAMVLLLSSDEDNINRRLMMARLCRYTSLYGTASSLNGTNVDSCQILNNKAYGFVLTHTPQNMPITWSDMKYSADIISVKMGATHLLMGPSEAVRFDGPRSSVVVLNDNVTISQKGGQGHLRDVLPQGLTGWRNFHVMLGKKSLNMDVKPDTEDISELRLMWRDIEDSLFATDKTQAQNVQRKTKRQAEEGEEVVIRVVERDGKDQYGNPSFRAVIVSDNIKGEGTLSPRDIVHYNVKNAKVTDFQTSEGKQLLLPAVVQKIDADDKIVFSMSDFVDDFVADYAEEGDIVRCRMTIKTGGGDLLLISEKGYSLKVPNTEYTPDLANGDFARVEITHVHSSGGKVDGEVIEPMEFVYGLDDNDCMRTLMRAYAQGIYEADDDDEADDDSTDDVIDGTGEMEPAELYELMSIIDRQSTLATKRSQAYNLMAIARLLAMTLGDMRKADEYHDRMYFVYLMQQFAINQWVETDEFDRHYMSSRELLRTNADLEEQVMRLFCVSRMDKDGCEVDLTRLMTERPGSLTASIAGLVMAYNTLRTHDMDAERRSIRNKINELLNIETRDTSHLHHMGEEGARCEFKTSMVFPPDGNLRPDKAKQSLKLLTVVCGMMNSQGGSLMVGVNDLGMAVGLDSDFREFSASSVYDEQKARDKMDNFFMGQMRMHMSGEATLYANTRFEVYNDRTIYVVDVTSAKNVMSVDGKSYRRVGSSTRQMDESELKAVEALKKNAPKE